MLPPLIGALGSQIAEVSVQSSKPDMQEVIGKHLPKVLKDKPHLAAALQAIPNPGQRLLMAYEFGITDPDYKGKKVTEEFSKQADKAKENARKPGSLGNVSGQGSRSEANFATMTDDEIEAHYQKVRFGS